MFLINRLAIIGTLGAVGHSLAMLESHPEIKRLFGIDQDPSALKIAEQRLLPLQSESNPSRI